MDQHQRCIKREYSLTLLINGFALLTLVTGCRSTAPLNPIPASPPNAVPIDEIATWLKIEYYPKNPKTPAYIGGQPSVIPISQLHSRLKSIGADIDVRKAPYLYCNLTPAQWTILRSQDSTKYPVMWGAKPDSSNQRLVATVDLKTDVFWTERMAEQKFQNELARMETAIRHATNQKGFSLRRGQKG